MRGIAGVVPSCEAGRRSTFCRYILVLVLISNQLTVAVKIDWQKQQENKRVHYSVTKIRTCAGFQVIDKHAKLDGVVL